MTPEEIDLLSRSAARLAPRMEAVARDFYDTLFSDHPELRPMFGSDLGRQSEKFAATLESLVSAVPHFESFAAQSSRLGRLHAVHGVSARHFSTVGDVLLRTLAAGDPGWDDATAEAWSAAYDLVAESMQLSLRASGTDLTRR